VPDGHGGAVSAVRIYLVWPDGTAIWRLSDEPGGYMNPSWAPDGSTLACSAIGPRGTRIVAIDVETAVVPMKGKEPRSQPLGRRPA
jgi:Tol biopolymer transport system component